MFNLLRAEAFKLKHSKAWWVLVAIIIGLTFILVLFPYFEEIGVFDKIESVTVEGPTDLSAIQVMIEMIYGPDLFFFIIIFSALGAFFIANENSNGTIKNIVSTGNRRAYIYVSKLIVFTIGAVIISLLFIVIPAIFGSMFFGVGELPTTEIIIEAGKIFALSLLYYFAFTSIITVFSILCRGSGIALLFSLGFYFLAGAGLSFLGQQYTIWQKMNEYSVYHLFSNIGGHVAEGTSMLFLVFVPVITTVVFTAIGLGLFQKKDVT